MSDNNNVFFVLADNSISLSVFHNVTNSGASIITLNKSSVSSKLLRILRVYSLSVYRKIKKTTKKNSIIIFDNESVAQLSLSGIRKLKNRNRVILYLIDELSNDYPTINKAKYFIEKDMFDQIYTYSFYDAEKYGFVHSLAYYSKIVYGSSKDTSYDAFFIANIKNRSAIINEFLANGEKNNANNLVYLAGDTNQIEHNSYHKIEYMSYIDSLKELMKCKCIIDLNDNNQAQSLRYLEAVVYNKKLISNNQNLKKLPFYNEKYMKIIKSIDEIDYKWIKNGEIVDYHYDGQFEPMNLISLIMNNK